MKTLHRPKTLLSVMLALYALVGCSPTVKIEPPDKPIVINLNVKIEHEIKIKVDKELDQLLADDELF
ncbi:MULTISPECIES: YnbE family lipoprotein [Shewanella]|uniref:YnbE family lipoprotein n=1 Tax=Shewanella fidelis TaxID=173509 RepID=A0AAW8NK12_9GAMM|nr:MULTISPECIES: YnbE family lipoprotein [Shewanella]MDR8523604.1 YnbE family lipoprotein [Shewanella fidelis]MDW4810151.1 YnbE family lipoprotein [Shewanella fidelis]MDW4814296.1 YnbE family lipoprotein [Shewanella fidelis]MDW4818387.1 YnbE family lipoprotein [Shewanella fidelis]MDW4823961.1 YnbE family lipoprotein [Shewanella fidelis]